MSVEELNARLLEWPTAPIILDHEEEQSPLVVRVWRTLETLRCGDSSQVGTGDLTGLLRFLLHRENLIHESDDVRLTVPRTEQWPSEEDWLDAGFHVETRSNSFIVAPLPWCPDWLPGVDETKGVGTDAVLGVSRRKSEDVHADPCITEWTHNRIKTYKNEGQALAIRTSFLMESGSTLVVNLPTGSGKSLVPFSIFARLSQNAGASTPLVLVVVPTVALALDQEKALSAMLPDICPQHVLAYHGGLSEGDKQSIKERIKKGNQQILFASPEAIVSGLRVALIQAAKNGLLATLVIDEAHLVAAWGDDFRPDFQRLTSLRSELLAACGAHPKLSTVLLSATLTNETLSTLRTLFDKPGPFRLVSASHLRPEPSYWAAACRTEGERCERVKEAIRNLPRPMVLYVSTRDEVEAWYQTLREELAIKRCGMVHGGSKANERSDVIDGWRVGDIDVVVATSAFGLGVDQGEVRTVLHACIPETLDRYYQEVGRAGRDGNACLSLVLHVPNDWEIARKLGTKTIIGRERGQQRYESMLLNAIHHPKEDGSFTLRLDTTVPDIAYDTQLNQQWNLRTILLMVRAGLLKMVPDTLPVFPPEVTEQERSQAMDDYFKRIRVSIRSSAHNDVEGWSKLFEPLRQRILKANSEDLDLMKRAFVGEEHLSKLLSEKYTLEVEGVGRVHCLKVSTEDPYSRRQGLSTSSDYTPPCGDLVEISPLPRRNILILPLNAQVLSHEPPFVNLTAHIKRLGGERPIEPFFMSYDRYPSDGRPRDKRSWVNSLTEFMQTLVLLGIVEFVISPQVFEELEKVLGDLHSLGPRGLIVRPLKTRPLTSEMSLHRLVWLASVDEYDKYRKLFLPSQESLQVVVVPQGMPCPRNARRTFSSTTHVHPIPTRM